MSQPPPYVRQFNFTGFSSAHPNQQQPGEELDAELNAIATTLSEALGNLELIQRDDTRLANGSVGPDQLDDMALLLIGQGGFTFRGLWAPSVIYEKGDVVSFSSEIYLVVSDHISDASAAVDITAGRLHGPILPIGSMTPPSGGNTDLSVNRDANTVTILSSTGADGVIQPATTSQAGVMTAGDKAVLDALAAGGGGGGSGSTNLSFSRTATSLTVISDTGTDATLPGASATLAGVMSAADKLKLDGLSPGGGTANAVNFVSEFGGVGDGVASNDLQIAAAEASAYDYVWLPEGQFYTTVSRDTLTKRYLGPGQFLYGGGLKPKSIQNASAYATEVSSTSGSGQYGTNENMVFSDYDFRTLAPGTRRNWERYWPSGTGTGPNYPKYFWGPSTPRLSIFENFGGWSGTSGILASSVSAGATTATLNGTVNDWSAAGLLNKQIGFVDAGTFDGVPGDLVTVTGASGSTITFTPALANSYAAGSIVSHGYRTMNPHELKIVEHNGGGDAYAWCARIIVNYPTLASQQDTFYAATGGIIGGDITLTQDGNYATGWECSYHDSNKDGAIIGSVNSYVRQNNTAARGNSVWLHDLCKMDGGGTGYLAYGLKPIDGVYTVGVAARVGLDFTRSRFSVAAVALPLGERIGFDADIVSPGSGNGWGYVATTINSMFIRGNSDAGGKFLAIQNQSSGFVIRPTAIQATAIIDAANSGFMGNVYRLSDPVSYVQKGLLIAGTDGTSDYIDLSAGATYRMRIRATGKLEFNGDFQTAAAGKVAWLTTNSYIFHNGAELRVTNDNGATSSSLGSPPTGIARGAITGLTLANDATNPNTHITIAVGQARDSTDTVDLKLTTGLIKRLDQAWALGTGNGALDTGSVAANTGYHVFLIRRTSDGLLDVLMSTSATSPTMPSGWSAFRRIGAILTDGSSLIRKFTQHGDYFELYYRTADFAGVANGAGPYLRQMVCPKGIPLKLRVFLQSTNSGPVQAVTFSGVFDPALGAPQLSTLKRAQIRRPIYKDENSQNASYGIFDGDVWCDSNGQVYTHSDNANDTIALGIYGWTDDRGQYL